MSTFKVSEAVRWLEESWTQAGQYHREGLFQLESAFTGGTGMSVRFNWDGWTGMNEEVPSRYGDMQYTHDYLKIPDMRQMDEKDWLPAEMEEVPLAPTPPDMLPPIRLVATAA